MVLHDILLVLHFIGLALGVGTGLANITLGIATRDMDTESRTKFFLRAFALGKNGSYGLLLLIVTGVGLMVQRGIPETFAWGGGAFHLKLTLVVVMIGLLGYMQSLVKKAKAAQGGPTMAQIPRAGKAMLVLGISTVICAVFAFH